MNAEALAAFLLERIAEREAAARRAGNARMFVDDLHRAWIDSPHGRVDIDRVSTPTTVALLMDHTALHLPGRVLAECAAQRRIIGRCMPIDRTLLADAPDLARAAWDVIDTLNKATLRDLASAYADHPDFRPEWAQGETRTTVVSSR